MSYVEVFKILKNVKPGDTLCTDLTIVEHGTWFSSFKRFLTGDDRIATIEMIEKAVKEFYESIEHVDHLNREKINEIEKVREGISGLMVTYEKDTKAKRRLNQSYIKLRKLIIEKTGFTSSEEGSSSTEDGFTSSEEGSSSTEDGFEIEPNPFCSDEKEETEDTQDKKSEETEDTQDKKSEETEDGFQKDLEEETIIKSPPTTPQELEKEEPHKKELEEKIVYKPEMCDFDDETKSKKALKFESYLKKKNQSREDGVTSRGKIQKSHTSRRTLKEKEKFDSDTRDKKSFRKLPKLHVITMGDVVSEVNEMPKHLPNPLSSISSNSKHLSLLKKDWYVEHII